MILLNERAGKFEVTPGDLMWRDIVRAVPDFPHRSFIPKLNVVGLRIHDAPGLGEYYHVARGKMKPMRTLYVIPTVVSNNRFRAWVTGSISAATVCYTDHSNNKLDSVYVYRYDVGCNAWRLHGIIQSIGGPNYYYSMENTTCRLVTDKNSRRKRLRKNADNRPGRNS